MFEISRCLGKGMRQQLRSSISRPEAWVIGFLLLLLFVCVWVFCLSVFVFRDWVSLCSFGAWPGTRSVAQADLIYPPASASRVLGLKACVFSNVSVLY